MKDFHAIEIETLRLSIGPSVNSGYSGGASDTAWAAFRSDPTSMHALDGLTSPLSESFLSALDENYVAAGQPMPDDVALSM